MPKGGKLPTKGTGLSEDELEEENGSTSSFSAESEQDIEDTIEKEERELPKDTSELNDLEAEKDM